MGEKLKKAYHKPEIKQVKLVPEEAVLQFCKTTVGSFKGPGRCVSVGNCQNKAPGT